MGVPPLSSRRPVLPLWSVQQLVLLFGQLGRIGGQAGLLPGVIDQFGGQVTHGQDQVSQAGGNGGARHSVVLGLLGALDQ